MKGTPRLLVVVVAALVVVGLSVAWIADRDTPPGHGQAGSGASPAPAAVASPTTPTESVEPSESPAPTTSPDALDAVAGAAVDRLLAEASRVMAQDSGTEPRDTAAVERVAVGAALGELLAQATEFDHEDWVQVGQPELAWVRVSKRSVTPSALTVRACVDSRAVTVLDGNGRPLPRSGDARTINVYRLTLHDGRWKVADHSFPARPDC